MSYIDVVQRTSLSWLIHARPYLTKRCSIKLKDEGAEIDDEGAAEFFSHRLRENQRTLVTLTLNEVEVISDLNELVFLMNQLSRDFDRIFEDSERSTFTAPSSLNDRLSTVARNGLVGKPRLQILQQQLQTLHNDAGFRWADIGRILGWEYCLWQNWFWQDIDMKGWSLLILLSVNSCVILRPTNHFYS